MKKFDKTEPKEIPSFSFIQPTVCLICKKEIPFGDFKHKEICWECFKNRVYNIADHCDSGEIATLMFMLGRVGEMFNKKI